MLNNCKNHKLLRILSLFLILIMAVAMLASCRKNSPAGESADESNSDTGDTAVTASKYEYDANGFVKDTIPEVNYENKKVKILAWIDDAGGTTLPSEGSTDEIDNELYLRRLRVSTRLGIIMDVQNENGGGASKLYEEFLTKVRTASGSGDGYDLINSYSLIGSTMAIEGLLTNLNTLTYPQTDMPWWPESVNVYEQHGKLFYLASNSSLQSLSSMLLMFCNSNMFTDAGMTDPVDEVKNGTWTMEKMMQYVNNFPIYDESISNSFYGLAVDDNTRMDAFFYSCGFHNTVQNNGKTEVAYISNTAIDRITALIDSMVPLFNSGRVQISQNTPMLMLEGKTALMVSSLYQIKRLETYDYAAIPMPKLDMDQEGYITIQSSGFDIWSVPITTKDAELSGLVIEAIASDDYRGIGPMYFENNAKYRYSSSEDTAKMFDIIRDSITYDFGRINQISLNYRCEVAWRLCFVQKTAEGRYELYANNTYATTIEENRTLIESELAGLLESYRQLS